MKKIISILLLLIISLSSMPVTCLAETSPEQVIRVGYYLLDNYQEKDDNGVYSGYYYDYLQEISYYTGWNYEFVEVSYSNCLDLLKKKQLDLVCGVDPANERYETMDFSERPAITTQYEFYAPVENDTLYYEDYENFPELNIGVLSSCKQLGDLDTFCESHNISYITTRYTTQKKLEEAAQNGDIDVFYTTSVSDLSNFKIIARLPDLSLCFATWQGNPIIEQINEAQTSISNISPDFEFNLYQTYMISQQNYRPDFTREELAFMEENPVIYVSYDSNWSPIEFYNSETDSFEGITAKVFQLIEYYSGLHFEYIKADNFTDVLSKLNSGEVNVITAMAHDYNWAIENNVYLTTPFLDSSVVVVHNATAKNNNQVIALPKSYYTSSIIAASSDYDDILYFDSTKECLNAVLLGKADHTYTNNHVSNYYLSDPAYRSLSATQITSINENLSIAVSRDSDLRLLSILNKSLLCISSEKMDSIILQYAIYEGKLDLISFIYAYPEVTISIMIIIFLIIFILLLTLLIIRSRRTNTIRKLSEIDSLTGLFNRRASQHLILNAMEADRRNPDSVCPLITIDLDRFKMVNDTYGHMEGDLLLIAVADVLRLSVRNTDIVGRMGGDEFIIYLSGITSKKTAETIAFKLCSAVSALSEKKKEWGSISASIGIAFGSDYKDWEHLYHAADTALYHAKENGKNQVISDLAN